MQKNLVIDGRYVVEGELGSGSMGVVFLARDVHLDRQVAIKVIAQRFAAVPDLVKGFRREAAALAAVRSQHVVQVYAFGPHEDGYFFAMEYIKGRNLMDIIDQYLDHGSRVPTLRAVSILRDVARGLEAAHTRGIVHRDVKPANVVIEEDTGRPVVIDFGIALSAVAGAISSGGGTPAYMAPEQAIDGAAVTHRSDIYALGCTGFELLSGQPPYIAKSAAELRTKHANAPVPKVSALRPDLVAFDPVFARALAKAPEDRFSTAAALGEALGVAFERAGQRDTAPPPSYEPPSSRDESGQTALPTLHVLVVDDDTTFRRLASRAVQLAFFRQPVRVSMASSGIEAIDISRESPPDLVLLDYSMPGMDGIQTLSVLRSMRGGQRARVIVMSGRAGDTERWRFTVLGVNQFLDKPVGLGALVDVVKLLAERSGWVLPEMRSTDND